MGLVKSITHSYTWSEYLFYYLERSDLVHLDQLLTKKPELVNEASTPNSISTPLHKAALNGNLEIVKLFVEKYAADVDLKTKSGETALIAAVKRNNVEVVKYLLQMKADPKFISDCALAPLDYAILGGFYPLAHLIFDKLPEKQIVRSSDEYSEIAKQYKYRYVNYKMFLEALEAGVDPTQVLDILKKQRVVLEDPVIDPRQSWKAWFLRNLDFKDPPLVERGELPADLQPQNRRFGKVLHFFSRASVSSLSQKPTFKPHGLSEAGLQIGQKENKQIDDQMFGQNEENKSIC